MKRRLLYISFLISVSLMMMLTACSDVDIKGYYISNDYIKTDAEIILDGNSGSTTYTVVTDGAWSFADVPTWMTISPMSGNGETVVTITMTDNPSAIDERKAQITLRTSNQVRTIGITQKPARELIESDIVTQTYTAAGGVEQFSIRTNTKWTLNLTGSFFTATPMSGSGNATIIVTCQSLESEEQRTGSLDIMGQSEVFRIPITQLGINRTLTLSPENVTVDAVANIVTIMLNGDASWTASSNAGWATVGQLSGMGSGAVLVTVDENTTTSDRVAVVTFTTSKSSISCQITQRAGNTPRFTTNTPTISNVSKYSATVSASYTSDFEVTEYGVCYSETNEKPTIADTHISRVGSAMSSNFSIDLEGLKSLTKYYVTVYARNKIGIYYSDVTTFTTTGGVPGENDNPTPNL